MTVRVYSSGKTDIIEMSSEKWVCYKCELIKRKRIAVYLFSVQHRFIVDNNEVFGLCNEDYNKFKRWLDNK